MFKYIIWNIQDSFFFFFFDSFVRVVTAAIKVTIFFFTSDFRSFLQTTVLQNFWREQPETILWLLCALPLWIKWADIRH